jgi:hypothetical protein
MTTNQDQIQDSESTTTPSRPSSSESSIPLYHLKNLDPKLIDIITKAEDLNFETCHQFTVDFFDQLVDGDMFLSDNNSEIKSSPKIRS